MTDNGTLQGIERLRFLLPKWHHLRREGIAREAILSALNESRWIPTSGLVQCSGLPPRLALRVLAKLERDGLVRSFERFGMTVWVKCK
jgi:DNA-binding IclR family transcriptional regulator